MKPALRPSWISPPREIAILAPLVIITILMGVYPKPIFDVTSASVAHLISQHRPPSPCERAPKLAEAGSRAMIAADLYILLPELILAVGAMVLLLIGVFRGDKSFGLRLDPVRDCA